MKGFLSFLIVLGFIFAILIAISSYSIIRHNQNWKILASESLYYKMQDLKHSHFLAVKRATEEGIIEYNTKYATCYGACEAQKKVTDFSGIPISEIVDCHDECQEEADFQGTVNDKINKRLDNLDISYFNENDRYKIKRWFDCKKTTALDGLTTDMRNNPQTEWDLDSCENYLTYTEKTMGMIETSFESTQTRSASSICILGFTLYDSYTDIALVGYIPNTESFESCCRFSNKLSDPINQETIEGIINDLEVNKIVN